MIKEQMIVVTFYWHLSILYDDKATNDCNYRRDDKKSYIKDAQC
jgi:hypothetical protein